MLKNAYNKILRSLYLIVSRNSVVVKEVYNSISADILKYSRKDSVFKSVYLNITEEYYNEFKGVEDLALVHECVLLILEIPEIDEYIEKRILFVLNIIKNRNIFLIISTRNLSANQRNSKWYRYLCKNGVVIYSNRYTQHNLNCIIFKKTGYLKLENDYSISETLGSRSSSISKCRILDKVTYFSNGEKRGAPSLNAIKDVMAIEDFARVILSGNKVVIYKKLKYFISTLGEKLIFSTLEKIYRKVFAGSKVEKSLCCINTEGAVARSDRATLALRANYKTLRRTRKLCTKAKADFIDSLALFILETFWRR